MNFCLNRLEDSGSPDPTGGFKDRYRLYSATGSPCLCTSAQAISRSGHLQIFARSFHGILCLSILSWARCLKPTLCHVGDRHAVMPVLKLCCASGGKFSSNEFLVFSRCLQGLFDVFLYLFSTSSHFAIVCISLRLFWTGAFLTNGLLFAQSWPMLSLYWIDLCPLQDAYGSG